MPKRRSYWNDELPLAPRQRTMSVDKFEKIRQHIHFNKNKTFISRGNPGHDRFHNIKPVIGIFYFRFQSSPSEQHLLIDKQIWSNICQRNFVNVVQPFWFNWSFLLTSYLKYTVEKKTTIQPDGEIDLSVIAKVSTHYTLEQHSRVNPNNTNQSIWQTTEEED